MTIDELIQIAQDEIRRAREWVFEDDSNQHAAIAQAAAMTAQAMILAQMTDTIERPGSSDRRVLNVDTGN